MINQMMNEADLQRLAQILQERGEGLAAINSGEAQLLKALGGSGEALPGTQGMGPAGGPIKSYQFDPSKSYTDNTNTTVSQTGGSANIGSFDDDDDDNTPSQPNNDNDTPPPPPPPPKFYDELGNEYNSAAERDAANAAIKTERATLATSFKNLTTDANFSLLKTKNELPSFTYLPESEIETAFNNAKAVAVNEAREQIPLYVEALNNTIRANPESGAQQIILTYRS